MALAVYCTHYDLFSDIYDKGESCSFENKNMKDIAEGHMIRMSEY